MYLDDLDINEYWDNKSLEVKSDNSEGKLITISGNSGAGKSTLLSLLVKELKFKKSKVIGINERVLHHPLLNLMFSNPLKYCLPIQLNFVIQRTLLIQRWLSLNYLVVFERSQFDNELYIQDHLEKGHITMDEYNSYKNIVSQLNMKIPDPTLMILLDVPAIIAIDRINQSERKGERPEEFSSLEDKEYFVHSWAKKYENFFQKIEERVIHEKTFETKVIRLNAEQSKEVLLASTLSMCTQLEL